MKLEAPKAAPANQMLKGYSRFEDEEIDLEDVPVYVTDSIIDRINKTKKDLIQAFDDQL